MAKNGSPGRSNTALQPIHPRTLYPLTVFQRITGLGDHAMRTARRHGLRVRRLGGRAFIWSDDFFTYLEQLDQQDGAKHLSSEA